VSLLMDGAPLIGEAVGVVGLGVLGQLVTSILTKTKLGPVFALDPRSDRRVVAQGAGAAVLEVPPRDACDLVIEVSGVMAGLTSALEMARADGRVIVGSWYGRQPQSLALGARIHRARQTVRFSQVSRVDSALAHRFSHHRRMGVASEWLSRLHLAPLITHRVAAEQAPEAYALLMAPPTGCLHIVLTWS
jgi:threonine dehydrogenase-like Zn-dependent dehydrogenase